MTTRKPITLNGAQLTQLAAADALDVGAGVVLNGKTLTFNRSIALAAAADGYTLTVPATGTAALREVDNTFATGQVIAATSYDYGVLLRRADASGPDVKIANFDGVLGVRNNAIVQEDTANADYWTFEASGQDRAKNGIVATTASYNNIPFPGMLTNSAALTPRGFNFTTDNQTINRTGFGIGIAAARSTPMIAIKNTGGPAIFLENGQFEMMVMSPLNPLVTNGLAIYAKANGAGTALWLRYRTTGGAWADVKIAGA